MIVLADKKTPQRMCAICRQVYPKRDLLRLVKTQQGDVFFDETGKSPGRGLYICPTQACVDQGIKGNRLSKTMGKEVEEIIKQQLKKAVKNDIRS